MIKILLDNLQITNPIHTLIHKSVDSQADYFESDIENTNDAHTSLFKSTTGQKLSISFVITLLPEATPKQSQTSTLSLRGFAKQSQTKTIFNGLCDTVEFHYHPKQLINIKGRDYTGLLLDEIITPALSERFTNKSASEIVKIIANQYGFTPDISTTSSTDLDDKLYSPGTHVWLVITELARKTSFDCYITKDKTLVFKQRKISSTIKRTFALCHSERASAREESQTLLIPSNLHFDKDITDSLALKVEIIGLNPKTKERMSYIAESPLRNRNNYKVISETHLELKTKSDVKLCAENKLKEYSKNLITGSFQIPLDPDLEPADCIQLKSPSSPSPSMGEGSGEGGFAGVYFITDITHESSVQGETTTVQFSSKPLSDAKTKEQTFPPSPQTFKL